MKYVSMDQIIDAVAEELKLSMEEAERLRQLKQVCEEEYERRNAPADDTIQDAIETVLTEEEIRKRLQTGQLLRGRLNVTRDNVREAFVTTSGGNQTFFIQFDHFNRAFHQDMVLIEPLPESQWGRPVGRRRLVHQSDNNDENDTDAAALDHHLATTPTVPSARVVAIDQPTRRVFVATMTDVPHGRRCGGAGDPHGPAHSQNPHPHAIVAALCGCAIKGRNRGLGRRLQLSDGALCQDSGSDW